MVDCRRIISPSSSSAGDSAYTSAVSRSSVSRSCGSLRSTISTRWRYQSAAARPTRLEVATRARALTLCGWSIAARIAIVPPSEKPAIAVRSTPSASKSPTRSAPSCKSVPSGLPSVVSPWPLRSYMRTRWRSIRSGRARRQARWSSASPWMSTRGSPRPASNHATSMSLHRASIFTERLAVDFARARQRELVEAMHCVRPLVARKPLFLQERNELFAVQLEAIPGDEERDR